METLEALQTSVDLAKVGATLEDMNEAKRLWAMALEVAAAVEGKLKRPSRMDIHLGAGFSPGVVRTLAALAGVKTALQFHKDILAGTGGVIESMEVERFGARVSAQGFRNLEAADLARLNKESM